MRLAMMSHWHNCDVVGVAPRTIVLRLLERDSPTFVNVAKNVSTDLALFNCFAQGFGTAVIVEDAFGWPVGNQHIDFVRHM